MGKRELLLIVAFVVVGVAVYQVTAPPPAPGETGFSFSRMIESVRREVRGNRASAQRTQSALQPIDAAVTEIQVRLSNGPVTIVGESRSDVAGELSVSSSGYDDAEAQQLAAATHLKFDQAGSVLFVSVEFPQPGTQRVRGLILKVPSRLHVRMIESNSGKLDISNVAVVEVAQARGETIIKQVPGRVTVSHRGGNLAVTDVGSVKLTTRGSDVRLAQIRGESILSTQAGDLRTTGIVGPIELDAAATDVALEGLESVIGAIRINAVAGSVEMRGLRSEARIDLRNASLDLAIDRPAAIAIYSEGDEAVEIAVPAGGFNLDALTREGRITTGPEGLAATWGLELSAQTDTVQEQRVAGAVNGGGPMLTIRTGAGPITLTTAAPAAPGTAGGSKPST